MKANSQTFFAIIYGIQSGMQCVCCYEFSLASLDPCITIHWGLEEKTAVEVC